MDELFYTSLYDTLKSGFDVMAYNIELENGDFVTVQQLVDEANKHRREKKNDKDIPRKRAQRKRASE